MLKNFEQSDLSLLPPTDEIMVLLPAPSTSPALSMHTDRPLPEYTIHLIRQEVAYLNLPKGTLILRTHDNTVNDTDTPADPSHTFERITPFFSKALKEKGYHPLTQSPGTLLAEKDWRGVSESQTLAFKVRQSGDEIPKEIDGSNTLWDSTAHPSHKSLATEKICKAIDARTRQPFTLISFAPANFGIRTLDDVFPLLTPTLRLKILADAVRGLSHMHKNGFFHGDMKTDNISAEDESTGMLFDYEFARPTNTRKNEFLGTPGFMHRSHFRHSDSAPSTYDDLFGLAMTIIEVCEGNRDNFTICNPILHPSFTTFIEHLNHKTSLGANQNYYNKRELYDLVMSLIHSWHTPGINLDAIADQLEQLSLSLLGHN
ncbi:MAG: hypothetical protein WC651_00015 [Candidatus Gracilibacteria bacterium]|jgi:hypothetical protein